MQNCICKKEAEIQQMKIDIAVAQSDIKQVKDDIKSIQQSLGKFYYMMLVAMGSSLLTLTGIVMNLIIDSTKK